MSKQGKAVYKDLEATRRITDRLHSLFDGWEMGKRLPKGVVSLETYLQTGKTFKIGTQQFVVDVDKYDDAVYLLLVKNGSVTPYMRSYDPNSTWRRTNCDATPAISYKGKQRVLLHTGDSTVFDIQDDFSVEGITISYECLLRLMSKPAKGIQDFLKTDAAKILDAIKSKKLVLIDHSEDSTVDRDSSPGRGYTQIRTGTWHRAATAVFRYGSEYWLCGQDEDTYFGVVLAEPVKTVAEAYTSLMPKSIRSAKSVCLHHEGRAMIARMQRQGEWFVVPVKHDEIPETCLQLGDQKTPKERVFDTLTSLDIYPTIRLPKKDGKSKNHVLTSRQAFIHDGIVYARNFQLSHPDHHSLECREPIWHKFVENTAVRSVSVEGVD